MAKGSFSFLDLEKELNKFTNETFKNREDALNESSGYLIKQFENATPVDTSKTKESWERSTKYKGVRYINNTAVTSARPTLDSLGVPIINLLEFGKRGKPFARKTFDASLPTIQKIFEEKLIKGD